MTSSDNETWEPQPPALLPPWHTPEREKLQEQARRFAMDEVLPVADELDPQKGEIPASLLARLAELGYFGLTVPTEQGGLATDGEDIEVVELPFADALAMAADGRIADAKTIMLLQWAALSGPFRELHDSEPVGS